MANGTADNMAAVEDGWFVEELVAVVAEKVCSREMPRLGCVATLKLLRRDVHVSFFF